MESPTWRGPLCTSTVLFSAAFFVGIVILLIVKSEDYTKQYMDAFTVGAWQTLKMFDRRLVREFERNHMCCGFHNVFDHCTEEYRLNIIYETVERNAMEQFWADVDQFDNSFSSSDFSSSDSKFKVDNRGAEVDYYANFDDYADYESDYDASTDTIPEQGEICENVFEFAEPPYYHMPCRPDLRFPDGPPRNVSQVCIKPSFEEKRICHLHGCRNAYFQLINQYVDTATKVFGGISVLYILLVLHIFWRRLLKDRCSCSSTRQYAAGRNDSNDSRCCC